MSLKNDLEIETGVAAIFIPLFTFFLLCSVPVAAIILFIESKWSPDLTRPTIKGD